MFFLKELLKLQRNYKEISIFTSLTFVSDTYYLLFLYYCYYLLLFVSNSQTSWTKGEKIPLSNFVVGGGGGDAENSTLRLLSV